MQNIPDETRERFLNDDANIENARETLVNHTHRQSLTERCTGYGLGLSGAFCGIAGTISCFSGNFLSGAGYCASSVLACIKGSDLIHKSTQSKQEADRIEKDATKEEIKEMVRKI